MDLLNVSLVSLLSIVVLFLLTKLIGNKQMSELNMFDYINGITIGSIAAELATSLQGDFLKPLLAMLIYGTVTFIIDIITNKCVGIRRFLTGKAVILLDNGKIYKENFKKSRLELNEFLTQCRIYGYFNLSEIQTAILESNGKISILPKTENKPLSPKEMKVNVSQQKINPSIIEDGKVYYRNLDFIGKNYNWLQNELHKQNIAGISNVYYAEYDTSSGLIVYTINSKKPENDLFQ